MDQPFLTLQSGLRAVLGAAVLGFTSCALFDRDPSEGENEAPNQEVTSPTTEVRVTGGDSSAATTTTATPTPAASSTPPPEGEAKKENIFARTFGRIFPRKPTTETADPNAPTATQTDPESTAAPESRYRVIVQTEGEEPQVSAANPPTEATTPPLQIAVETPTDPTILVPREGFFSRTWHRIFPRKVRPPAAAVPQWMGTIKLIHPAGNYALIDSQPYVGVAPGTLLNSVGNESETGSLRVSADRNPPFFIADIVSGRPQVGDRVYSPQP